MSLHTEERWDHREATEPVLDDARLDAGWSAIESRLTPRRPQKPVGRRRWAAGGFVTAAAAAAVLWLWLSDTPWVGTTLATADETAAVQLPEGSQVIAEQATELRRVRESDHEVRLELRAGAAFFDVVRRPERLFAVEAGAVEVRVVGTAFRVARIGERVEVEVQRGAVDVRRGGELVRLGPGQSWSGLDHPEPEPQVFAEPVPIEAAPTARRRSARPSADELFEAASENRRIGQTRDAARLYARLVARFPEDPRVALAAFELGRIRLDVLDDARGAASAFRRSLASDDASPFVQDVRARLVDALAAAGDSAGCEASRDAYLAHHPEGRHVAEVTRACE